MRFSSLTKRDYKNIDNRLLKGLAMEISETIRLLPKVEQHVHILGSIRPATLMKAIEDSNSDSEYSSLEELEKQFVFRDFHHFLSVYLQAIEAVRDERYFEIMAYELLESSRQSNVKYVEMSFSAPDHIEMGLDFEMMMKSIERGIERGRQDFGFLQISELIWFGALDWSML